MSTPSTTWRTKASASSDHAPRRSSASPPAATRGASGRKTASLFTEQTRRRGKDSGHADGASQKRREKSAPVPLVQTESGQKIAATRCSRGLTAGNCIHRRFLLHPSLRRSTLVRPRRRRREGALGRRGDG